LGQIILKFYSIGGESFDQHKLFVNFKNVVIIQRERKTIQGNYNNLPITILKDKKFPGTQKDFEDGLNNSHMVYIGKLSSFTTEQQIYSYFSRIGLIKRIIMGINRIDKTPCGFCFVE
jgi:hypothetical protein